MSKDDGKPRNGIDRNTIDKADLIEKTKVANLINHEVLLGISGEQSEEILKKLYKEKNAQRPN